MLTLRVLCFFLFVDISLCFILDGMGFTLLECPVIRHVLAKAGIFILGVCANVPVVKLWVWLHLCVLRSA